MTTPSQTSLNVSPADSVPATAVAPIDPVPPTLDSESAPAPTKARASRRRVAKPLSPEPEVKSSAKAKVGKAKAASVKAKSDAVKTKAGKAGAVAKDPTSAPGKPTGKSSVKAAAKPADKSAERAADKPGKLVRDSFTMPMLDFALIATLKSRALTFQRPTKKSELLRAGLQALESLNDAALQSALAKLVPLKTGRPKKAG